MKFIAMKKLGCWLVTILFLTDFVQAQKTYEVTWLDYGNGMLPKQRKTIVYWQIYNADNLLTEQRYPPQTGVEKRIIYRYNDKKYLVAEEEVPQENWKPVKKYNYDPSGSLKDVSWTQRNKKWDSVDYYESYQYDAEGRLVYKEQKRSILGHANGTTGWKYSYELIDGNMKMTETWFVNGKKKNKKKYTLYNDKGLIVRTRDGSDHTKYIYEYDEKGDWIVKQFCVKDSGIGMWRCEGEFRRVLK
jgi:hypothetical protein